MTKKDLPVVSPDIDSNHHEPTREELALFRQILPYIATCLTVNHEINNALAGVIGYGEFLSLDSDSLTKTQQAHVRKVMASAQRIQKLVRKLAEAKAKLAETVDLKELVDRYESR